MLLAPFKSPAMNMVATRCDIREFSKFQNVEMWAPLDNIKPATFAALVGFQCRGLVGVLGQFIANELIAEVMYTQPSYKMAGGYAPVDVSYRCSLHLDQSSQCRETAFR